MADYIEGKRPILEALNAQVPLRLIYRAEGLDRDSLVESIERKAKKLSIPIKVVSRSKLDSLSVRKSHQGMLAETKPFVYRELSDLIAKSQDYADAHDGRALLVVLDHITDAGNLGAVARSAESVGASGLVIPRHRSASISASTYKSSAGAIVHLPVASVSNIAATLKELKEAGFWVAAASEQAEELLWNTPLVGKIALVMGNEQEGIARLVLKQCDYLMALPQMGKVSSLNVAQAATVCMYEWLRQNL